MIYFDNASTTKIFKDVAEFMCVYSQENFYNPSGIYSKSIKVFSDLENAKNKLREYLGADDFQVVFTASATEANNIALSSFAQKNKKILIGGGEHSSIYETAQHLKQQGFDVDFVHLTTEGKVDVDDLIYPVSIDSSGRSIINYYIDPIKQNNSLPTIGITISDNQKQVETSYRPDYWIGDNTTRYVEG